MKGIIGRKAGMTSVFTDHGQNIPVTVIEVQPNVVTNVLTEDKHGYKGIQLAAFDRRDKTSTKPLIGHFKKVQTNAKRFVREIRDMEGYDLGAKVDSSIFKAGELVDVTGTSKGHGFQGNIKRHNQKIGPKSHGGGGGSQPVRQVGSIGDVSSNRVFKGMTMPGQMGNTQVTVQNLEIVSIDSSNNIILVKGSVPGHNKGFVVLKEAIKGLPSKDAIELVNVKEAAEKNALLEEAKKWGADVNTEMSLGDMKAAINAAREASEAEAKAKEEAEAAKKAEEKAEKLEEKAAAAKEAIEKAQSAGDDEKVKEAQKKAEALEKQAEVAKEEAIEEAKVAKEAEAEAKAKEAEAEKLQVETEVVDEEPKKDASENKGGE